MLACGGLRRSADQSSNGLRYDQLSSSIGAKATSGRMWTCGQDAVVPFNTILPPNSVSCHSNASNGIYGWDPMWIYDKQIRPPTSNHPGGVNVAMADGRVTFHSEEIDAGDPGIVRQSPHGPSPYGVFGALGTRAGSDVAAFE